MAVYRFGSSVQGATGPDSDIDIAVLSRARLEPRERFSLEEELSATAGCSLDLIDLRSASTVLKMEVVRGGLVIHDADPVERGLFEDRVFSDYARLNEERQGILERVAAEGVVHG